MLPADAPALYIHMGHSAQDGFKDLVKNTDGLKTKRSGSKTRSAQLWPYSSRLLAILQLLHQLAKSNARSRSP